MIQRIQSVFLFLAVLTMISAVFFNIWISVDTSDCILFANSFQIGERCGDTNTPLKSTVYLLIIQLVFAAISLYSIFCYKDRKRQMVLGAINSLVGSSFLVVIFFLTKSLDDSNTGTYGMGFFLPLAAIFLNILANRFIKKDEKLVKSLDRIR